MKDQRHPHIHVDPRRPRDGTRPTLNPPLFAWKPRLDEKSFGLRLATDEDMAKLVIDLDDLTEPLHLPERALAPGRYWWQWRSGGDLSQVFNFEIDSAAVTLEVLAAQQWLTRLPAGHPRLHCRPEWVEQVRDRAAEDHPEATLEALALADEVLGESHTIAEPPFMPDRNKDFEAARRIWFPTMWGSRRFVKGAETLALAYLLTGDRTYGRPACERMASISEWDPDGSTWLGHNDEAHMSVIWHGPQAVDWVWDCFAETERVRVIEQFRRRGQITYEHMHDLGSYGISRFDSHAGREIVFLALIAFTFHDYIPEAKKWLQWLRPVLCGIWPIWARDDGGWAQGTSYGLAYVSIQQMFASAFSRGVGIDVYRRPFWRNHARWRRWVLPPYAEAQGFGDHSQRWRTSTMRNADLVELIGLETKTEEFDGYVSGLRAQTEFDKEPNERHMPGINSHLFLARLTQGLAATEASVAEEGAVSELTAPAYGAGFDGGQSILRQFPTVGWAALRTNIKAERDGTGDVALVFRSSPLGSISHSHANNNDFILHVGGRVMAMPSGFYGGVMLGYGGDHHANWVWHTKSHNCVTLSDAGQIMRSEESVGRVDHAFEDEALVYFVGVADASYADRAERCRRHVVFYKSSSCVAMIDEFVGLGDRVSTLQWNLHTFDPFDVDEAERVFSWRRGDSQVQASVLYHDNAIFSLSEGWDPTPQRAEHEAAYPRQYNLRFTCNLKQHEYLGVRHRLQQRPSVQRNLAVVLAPSCPGSPQAEVRTARHGDAEEALIGAGGRLVVHSSGGDLVVDGESLQALAAVEAGGRRYRITDEGITRI
ncbi:MAG: DUF4962 domain-containing protein [Candidatus Latescibacterota bacterium]